MKVTKDTPYDGEFVAAESLMEDKDKKALTDAAVRSKFGEAGFWGMTLGGLFAAMRGDLDAVATADEAATVFGTYRLREFPTWLDDFLTTAAALTPRPTAKQARASQGCVKITFEESVYILMRRYFGLQSFDAVNTMTAADYILAKKDDYNTQTTERNMMRIAQEKGGAR